MPSVLPPPSPEAQLLFLTKLQRLFAEGDFTATYKFALLITLADLSVELGADDGSELVLTNRQIGEHFIGLYWQHCLPYSSGHATSAPGVLVQNNGAQAAVVSAVSTFRANTAVASPQAAARLPGFRELVSAVTNTVSAQPLNYLQNFGGGTDEFLYERTGAGKIRLKPSVAYCLRRFYPLVQQLARSHWIDHIKQNSRNLNILGATDDLEDFLFSSSRQSLQVMAAGLRKLDEARCFYCGNMVTTADVDHYIPFSLYPRDLAHNFVLAHPSCNRSKSDTLAALPHLERWLARLHDKADALAEIGSAAGFQTDTLVTRQVGAWAYTSALSGGGKAWVTTNAYTPIDDTYTTCFA
ncbi:HNH endonuclease [Aromatoleum toluolicum]|uniref:HNH endonuclease n=1 Tax=Aromatoleum toluolicum TaxID=90060 RepID=UPI00210B0949|nr:HNH endonuclease [Aromatoleum toluolicum]NMF98954.2 HNH endonuclease [Aromatoleum toluolicum]